MGLGSATLSGYGLYFAETYGVDAESFLLVNGAKPGNTAGKHSFGSVFWLHYSTSRFSTKDPVGHDAEEPGSKVTPKVIPKYARPTILALN